MELPAIDRSDTAVLIDQARQGDAAASAALLDRHRARLRRMIAVRMDPRLGRRIDPSDVVQDTLAVALGRLPRYLREEPLPFYPWLRAIAWNRLVDLHRQHVRAGQRSVDRERGEDWPLGDRSARLLAERLCSVTSSGPSARLMREELRQRVRAAMLELPEPLREVLVLRHLEEMSVAEVAAVARVSEGTVKSRHFRALARLREILEEEGDAQ